MTFLGRSRRSDAATLQACVAEVIAAGVARARVLLPRIQAIAPRRQLPDHHDTSGRTAEDLPHLALRGLETAPIRRLQRLSGAIEVEIQHRHGGLELRPALGPAAALHGALETGRDRARRSLEDPARQVHRVRRLLNVPDPALHGLPPRQAASAPLSISPTARTIAAR